MSESLKYCMGCMESIPYDTVICPKCGYNEEAAQPAPYLKAGSLIMRKYLVGKVISNSADTISYIGANIETGQTVTINEFYPEKIVTRSEGQSELNVKLGYDSMYSGCLQSFLKLWRGLDVFKDAKCLPNVLDIVDFNGTVYSVCAFKDCITLRQYFKNCNTPLTWARAFSAFKPIMYALKKLNYSGIIHANLNPDTVLVGTDGKLHISGFSIPQCHSGVPEFTTEPAAGFAPVELYEPTGATASTDIYSVTALLYYSVTLQTPPDALSRVINDTASLPASVASTISRSVIDGLIHGLSVHPENRYNNFDVLINALTPPPAEKASPAAKPTQKDNTAAEIKQTESADPTEAEEETEEPEAAVESKNKKHKTKDASPVSLAIRAFFAGFLVCVIIFCSLYATVLYKDYPIDFLDKIFAPFSFLPMNNEEPTTLMPTTTVPVPTEPNYITVADFVNNHTYDTVRSNPYFNENYKFNFKFEESHSAPKNAIISQSVEAGESVLAGVEITLVISEGTSKIKLPDVVDMNYLDATRILEKQGFKVKYDMLKNNGNHTEGDVYGMDKIADGLYEKGTEVTLQVWETNEEAENDNENYEDEQVYESDE